MRKQRLREIRLMVKDSLPHWKKSIEVWEERCEVYGHDAPDVGYLVLNIGVRDWRIWRHKTGHINSAEEFVDYDKVIEVLVWPESTVDDLMEEVTMMLDELMDK